MKPRAAIFLIPALMLMSQQLVAQSNATRELMHVARSAYTPASDRKAGEIIIEPASLTTPNGETIVFELGTLYVPENRSDPKALTSRILSATRARIASTNPGSGNLLSPTLGLPAFCCSSSIMPTISMTAL